MMNYANFLSAAPDLENISLPNAAIVAVLGYAVVFVGLIALMLVVIAIGKAFTSRARKAQEAAPAVSVDVAPAVPAGPVAPGAAGELKLHNVEPRTAAMLMAIVADKMGKPVSELRFISIREVE